MRAPTLQSAAYAWHRSALAGKKPAITHEPECGWFRRKLQKGGAFVGVRIFYEQPVDPETGELVGDEVLRCEVDGKRRDPAEEWTWIADNPISQEDFLQLTAPQFATSDRPNSKYPF